MQSDQSGWVPGRGRGSHGHHHHDEGAQAQAEQRMQRKSANMYVSAVLSGGRAKFERGAIAVADESIPASSQTVLLTLLQRSWGRISRIFAAPGRNDGA